jgi:hypothetical protein
MDFSAAVKAVSAGYKSSQLIDTVDTESGFHYGGTNLDTVIRSLTQLNGRAIADITAHLHGFSGPSRRYWGEGSLDPKITPSLVEHLLRRNAEAVALGLSHQEVASPMILAYARVLEAETDQIEFSLNGRRYGYKCPFYFGCVGPSAFGDGDMYPGQSATFANLETGEKLHIETYQPFRIWKYGFYGENLSPRRLRSFFGYAV